MVGGCQVAYTKLRFQVTTLKQGVSEVLSLLLPMKNTFAPINRIPPDVFSLIPDYWGHQNAEQDIISLTHVCHDWRKIFTSRPSFWTHLDCRNTDKTRVYIERSKSLPLEISLGQSRCIPYCNDALLMTVTHTNRLSSLTIFLYLYSKTLSDLLNHFPFPAPLLKELTIVVEQHFSPDPIIPGTIFPEHLPPLCKLSLSGVVTHLPWRNLSNLTVFEYRHASKTVDPLFVAQLLDFFESAPLLCKIILYDSIPTSSRVPPERVIPLLNLKMLIIYDLPAASTFLNHLSIPTGTSLSLRFSFPTGSPRIPACFVNNLGNLHHITTVSLFAGGPSHIRLNGPSGRFRARGRRKDWDTSSFFQSLDKFNLSKTRIMSVTAYALSFSGPIEGTPIFRTLLLMDSLRTLTLIKSDNLHFIRALDPKQNKSGTVLCSELEELVLYIEKPDRFYLEELKVMVLHRAERSSKLSSITIVSLARASPKWDIFSLREYVSRLEYKLEVSSPEWDAVFDDGDDYDYDKQWDAFPSHRRGR